MILADWDKEVGRGAYRLLGGLLLSCTVCGPVSLVFVVLDPGNSVV